MELKRKMSWSAHFASLQEHSPTPAITALLPLFRDNAHSLAMVKHGMDIVLEATDHVNKEQILVITVDQPLYALAKKIQWSWTVRYGEKKYFVMLGGLHVEMAVLGMIGDWLAGSGWSAVMTTANVTTEGRADNLQKGHATSRAQWAHQVSEASLFHLMKQAYAGYQQAISEEERLSFKEWRKDMETTHPQFTYWSKTPDLELLFLQFFKSQCDANFTFYLETLVAIMP